MYYSWHIYWKTSTSHYIEFDFFIQLCSFLYEYFDWIFRDNYHIQGILEPPDSFWDLGVYKMSLLLDAALAGLHLSPISRWHTLYYLASWQQIYIRLGDALTVMLGSR